MEQKKELTWEERHPNGNLSHHTFIDGFDDLTTLDEVKTKVALRVLKNHLQAELGFVMSDSLFVDIFKKIPYLAPARPICEYSILYGFIQPLKKILKAHNVPDENLGIDVSTIMRFFKVGGNVCITRKRI